MDVVVVLYNKYERENFCGREICSTNSERKTKMIRLVFFRKKDSANVHMYYILYSGFLCAALSFSFFSFFFFF